jgi:dynein heavy chain
LPKPPAGVDLVTSACLVLIEHEYKNHKWDRAKKMMQNVEGFKQSLQDYDGRTIPEDEVQKISKFIEMDDFKPELMKAKSAAAANLCTWVVAIYTFNRIYVKVRWPLAHIDEEM